MELPYSFAVKTILARWIFCMQINFCIFHECCCLERFSSEMRSNAVEICIIRTMHRLFSWEQKRLISFSTKSSIRSVRVHSFESQLISVLCRRLNGKNIAHSISILNSISFWRCRSRSSIGECESNFATYPTSNWILTSIHLIPIVNCQKCHLPLAESLGIITQWARVLPLAWQRSRTIFQLFTNISFH